MAEVHLTDLIPVSECEAQMVGKDLRLSGYGYVRTPDVFPVPLRIVTVAETDSTNLRLHFAKGHIILNWEAEPGTMACYEPVHGHGFNVKGKGQIPVETWVRVEWALGEDEFRVLVDDELRYSNMGESASEFHKIDYRGLIGSVGIGPAFGSVVTVRSLSVEPMR